MASVLKQLAPSGAEGPDQVGDECGGFGGEHLVTPGVVADLYSVKNWCVAHEITPLQSLVGTSIRQYSDNDRLWER